MGFSGILGGAGVCLVDGFGVFVGVFLVGLFGHWGFFYVK